MHPVYNSCTVNQPSPRSSGYDTVSLQFEGLLAHVAARGKGPNDQSERRLRIISP
jgi:hypothetical protein